MSELKNGIAVLMGGRAFEHLIFDGDISTGAADDLPAGKSSATAVHSTHEGTHSSPRLT